MRREWKRISVAVTGDDHFERYVMCDSFFFQVVG